MDVLWPESEGRNAQGRSSSSKRHEQRQLKLRGGPDVTGGAMLLSLRFATMCSLAAVFWYFGVYSTQWYREEISGGHRGDTYTLNEGKFSVGNSSNLILLFTVVPLMGATLFGALHEALWIGRRLRAPASSSDSESTSPPKPPLMTSVTRTCSAVLHYKLGPLLRLRAPWITVGEALVGLGWVAANICLLVYGTIRRVDGQFDEDNIGPCADAPAKQCWQGTHFYGLEVSSRNEFTLMIVAFQFGYVCTANFTLALLPVSRTSRVLTGMGVSFERAVLYHKLVGHMAFWALILHGVLYVIYWLLLGGFSQVWEESVKWPVRRGTNVPFGWMTIVFGLPMWITSIATIRKHYYALFKAVHWCAIPVLVFACLHNDNVAYFLIAPMLIYAAHIATRLASWQRWRMWQTWPSVRALTLLFSFKTDNGQVSSSSTDSKALTDSGSNFKANEVVFVAVRGDYVVLSVAMDSSSTLRGGAFAYISCPGALPGRANEAHAFSVAVRGVPPHEGTESLSSSSPCCTFYIKRLGPWTEALLKLSAGVELAGDPSSLIVDMDGPYNQSGVAFTSHAALGAERVVLVTGGSGLASFLGFLQDWSLAAAATTAAGGKGTLLPEVHLIWCTRSLQEMELLGTALPTLLAQAGELGSTKFSLTLHCTAKAATEEGKLLAQAEEGGGGGSGSLMLVEWPSAASAAATAALRRHTTDESNKDTVHRTRGVPQASYVPAFLDVMRTASALAGGYVGVMFANYEEENRGGLRGYHQGGLVLALSAAWAIAFLVVWELMWVGLLKHCCTPIQRWSTAAVGDESYRSSAVAQSTDGSAGDSSIVRKGVDGAEGGRMAPTNASHLRQEGEETKAGEDEAQRQQQQQQQQQQSSPSSPSVLSSAPVQVGRPDLWELLSAEKRRAEEKKRGCVRVLASGPDAMVKECVRAARDIDWKLFAVEEFSFEL